MSPDVGPGNVSRLNTALMFRAVRMIYGQHSFIVLKNTACASETDGYVVLLFVLSQIIIIKY
jgi:hypothetical protein